jgi:hypothetical protein
MATRKLPTPLYFLFAFLVLFAIGSYMGSGAIYGQARIAGVPPDGMWDFQNYPGVATASLCNLIETILACSSALLFLMRDPRFPIFFAVNYAAVIVLGFVSVLVASGTTGQPFPVPEFTGVVIGKSALYLPWIIYLYRSPKAKAAFSRATPDQAGMTAVQ